MPTKPLLIFVLLLLIPRAVGSEPPSEEVVQFYQCLKKAPSELEACGLIFGEKLQQALAQGDPDHIAQAKVALTDVLLTLHRIKADNKLLKVVPSRPGQELLAAVEEYLKQQEKSIVESGPAMIRIAADASLAQERKKTEVAALIQRNRQAAVQEAPLTRALMAYAREHDLVGEPTVEFRAFIPPDRSCRVEMPDLTENKTSDINGIKNTYYLAEHKHGVFMLSYADIAPAGENEAALQKRLDEARTGVINKLDLKIMKESAITLAGAGASTAGHPGRELEGSLPDKSISRIRLFIANGRLYQVWVVGAPSWAVSAEATRFLKSLELLK